MEAKQIEVCKKKLLELRSEHIKEMQIMEQDNLRNSMQSVSGNLSAYSQHMAETAADSFEREKNIGLLSTVNSMIKEINDALCKINNNSYGICEICNQEISFIRLEAIPYARHCINCKRNMEKK
ncbi:MAG: TraR/DksA C4-type zinc finger protein [bacterium]|nr:TraR/DksA C4-type zinc finger protein [bacterium]